LAEVRVSEVVVAQHPAAPGQGVLVEGGSLLILAQLAEISREPGCRGEGRDGSDDRA
jgi:hypothetical protein